MLVAPNPEFLLHRKSPGFYNELASRAPRDVLNDEEKVPNDQQNEANDQDLNDIAFTFMSEEKNYSWLRHFDPIKILIYLSHSKNPNFLGLLLIKYGKCQGYEIADSLLKEKSLDPRILTEMVKCIINDPLETPIQDKFSLNNYVQMLLNAQTLDSYYELAQYYIDIESKNALAYFILHHSLTYSFLSLEGIALVYSEIIPGENSEISLNALRYCVSQGSIKCLKNAFDLFSKSNGPLKQLGEKYLVKSKELVDLYVPYQKTNVLNRENPDLPEVTDPIERPNFESYPFLNSIGFPHRKIITLNEKKLKEQNKAMVDPNLILRTDSFPILFLKTFDLASDDFRNRNLDLCKKYIQIMKDKYQVDIIQLPRFLKKLNSNRTSDLIKCGFIQCLNGKYSDAAQTFFTAFKLGSNVAATMLGIIYFHGLNNYTDLNDQNNREDQANTNDQKEIARDTEKGIIYFLHAPTNPISLAHLSAIYPNSNYIDRFKDIVNCKEDGKVFEWMGDIFWYGVKLPKNPQIAEMFYGIALNKYEEQGDDTHEIIMKINQVSS